MKNSLKYLAAAVVALIIGGGIGYAVHGSKNSNSMGSMPGMTMPTMASTDVSQIAKRASATAHNDQDVMFAQMMISHHQQALDMAKLAETRAQSAQVKALAAAIEGAQQPEIDTMSGWLQAWGKPTTSSSSSMGSMNGEMSQSDMNKLTAASGTDFDKLFLQQMTQHHDGAITMAQAELTGGQYADALGLAGSIAITQQAQVAQMQQLLKQ